MKQPLLSIAAGMICLAGCVTPPPDQPKLKPVSNAAAGLSTVAAPSIGETWWTAYADPQFNHLADEALAGSPTLAQAVARLQIAAAASASAEAGLYPQATLGAEETRERFSGNDIIPPPYGRHVYWRGDITANLSWSVDFWGRQAAMVAQDRDQQQAAGLDIEGARLALTSGIAQTYADLDHAYALADIAHNTLAQRRNILLITRRLTGIGLGTNVELREAEGAVAEAQAELEQAESQKLLAVHQIAVLTGAGASSYGEIARPHLAADTALPLPASLPADLLARRPDILAAKLRIEASVSGRKAAKAAFYPNVSLTAFSGLSSIGISDLFRYSSFTYGAGPAIHLPLFDAGRLRAEYRSATADVDAAVASYNDSVLRAVQQTADALTETASLDRQAADQHAALGDAQAAYDLAQDRYRSGVTDYLTVLNTESTLLAARRNAADVASAQLVNRIRLLVAVGGSFDPSRVRTDPETSR